MANVLVIDDDEDITRFLYSQLTEEGHHVVVAHQGDEGMAKALHGTPDLIMLDVFLPDSTGYQICSQIRKNSSTHAVPIIMMTGAARFPSQQQFGLERGANEYISKPFNVIEVGELINKYIGPGHLNPRKTVTPEPRLATVSETATEAAPHESSDDLEALSSFLEQSMAQKKAAYYENEDLPPQESGRPSEAVGNGVVKISFMVPPPSSSYSNMDQQPVTPPTPKVQPKPSKPISAGTPSRRPLMPQVDESAPAYPPVQRPASRQETARIMPEQPKAPVVEQPAPTEGEARQERPVTEVFAPAILASKERFVEFSLDIFALTARLCSTHAEKILSEKMLNACMAVGMSLTESRTATSKEDFMGLLQKAQKDLRDTAYWLSIAAKAGLLKELGKTDLEKACQTLTTLLNDFVKTQTLK